LKVADDFTIKNPEGIVKEVMAQREYLKELFKEYGVPGNVVKGIEAGIVELT